MTDKQFTTIVNDTLKQVKNVLCTKQKEYATEDRLHGFKYTAVISKNTPKQALFGMMVKHLGSIIDGIHDDIKYTPDKWDEKIIDTINYLILLRALVIEEYNGGNNAVR